METDSVTLDSREILKKGIRDYVGLWLLVEILLSSRGISWSVSVGLGLGDLLCCPVMPWVFPMSTG